MKKCYRVETNNGNGPFQTHVSDKFCKLIRQAYHDGKHPIPVFSIQQMDWNEIFAFKNMSTILKWFDAAMRNELHKHGYHVAEYKVPAYSRSDDIQVTFLQDCAKLIKYHSLKELL